ncbi:hypothetical protein LIER_10956 [Lithospermum erythrorhizon]|uniref:Uncharacterized protein n=1 Tax=Lithospermum erythrorhizon TaxID=34254 RepID=A0AAV3PLJ9_LITER
MGRKGSWISAVKKVISPPSKEKKEKKTRKSKGWFWKRNRKGLDSIQEGIDHAQPSPVREAEGEQMKYVDSVMEADNYSVSHSYSLMNTEIVQDNHANLAMDAETEQERHARAVARATANASEAAVVAAQAAAEVVRLTASVRSSAKSKEEIAAIKIQSIFKGYMARRSLRSIKGLVRLKKLVQGQSLKRQAITTLRCMQTMSRVQAEVRARRIRMSEENCAFQRHLQQKHRKELEKSRASVGEDWNGSAQSKEQFEANQQRKTEAAIKRERTLAYAYSHQVISTPSLPFQFLDPLLLYHASALIECTSCIMEIMGTYDATTQYKIYNYRK